MKNITFKIPIQRKNAPPHKRAYWVSETAKLLNRPFKQVLGITRTLTVDEIESLLLKAKSWETNPQALYWKLYKELLEDIKKDKLSTPTS